MDEDISKKLYGELFSDYTNSLKDVRIIYKYVGDISWLSNDDFTSDYINS